jgi:hypothetical protein
MTPQSPQDRDFPWWLVVAGGLGAWLFWNVLSDDVYSQVLARSPSS